MRKKNKKLRAEGLLCKLGGGYDGRYTLETKLSVARRKKFETIDVDITVSRSSLFCMLSAIREIIKREQEQTKRLAEHYNLGV